MTDPQAYGAVPQQPPSHGMAQQPVAPPGWYPFPDVQDQIRYWDGVRWTDHWQTVNTPGRKLTWGVGKGATLQLVLGIVLLVMGGFGGLGALIGVFVVADPTEAVLQWLFLIAYALIVLLGVLVVINASVLSRREAERARATGYQGPR